MGRNSDHESGLETTGKSDSNKIWADIYDLTNGPLAVKLGAIEFPESVASSISALRYPKNADGSFQPIGFDMSDVNMFTTIGTIELHTDDIDPEITMTLGVILENEAGHQLTDGMARFPLPIGTIYRLDPHQLHGTCHPNGSQSKDGKFAFLTIDYHRDDEHQTLTDLMDWVMEAIDLRLKAERPH